MRVFFSRLFCRCAETLKELWSIIALTKSNYIAPSSGELAGSIKVYSILKELHHLGRESVRKKEISISIHPAQV